MSEKKIKFEDLTDDEFSNMTDEELENVDFPSDLFYNKELAERARKLEQEIKDGKYKGDMIVKGDERFKGF